MQYICPLIVVKDITVSRQFYEEVLGQKIKYDFGENVTFEGDFSIHLEKHYQGLLGDEHGPILKKANNFELYFETTELDTIIPRLKDIQIEFIHDIKEQPWGQRVARFYDPDNHTIEVGETLESLVLRYHHAGMGIKDIEKRTSLPKEFIEKVLGIKSVTKDELV